MEIDLLRYFLNLQYSTVIVLVTEEVEMTLRMTEIYMVINKFKHCTVKQMDTDEVKEIDLARLKINFHVFILDNFIGNIFDYLNGLKVNIDVFGIPLMERMLKLKHKAIIDGIIGTKIYHCAFKDFIVCASDINETELIESKTLVNYMNGQIINEMNSTVTHFVSTTTKTLKYQFAVKNNIPIYNGDWIKAVWTMSMEKGQHLLVGDAPDFFRYKLSPFTGLLITFASNIEKSRKNKLEITINYGEGKFEETFSIEKNIDILLMDDIQNPEYNLAVKNGIPILKTKWIDDSTDMGYSLPYDNYMLQSSEIQDALNTSISSNDSSVGFNSQDIAMSTCRFVGVTKDENYYFLECYPMNDATKLGKIFNGYSFIIEDFSFDLYQKIEQIMKICGATVCKASDLKEATHVLIYDEQIMDLREKIKSKGIHPIIIHYKWLVECLKQNKRVQEDKYIVYG